MESLFIRYKNALVLMLVLLAQVVLLAMQVRRPAPDLPDGHNVRLWRYWVASLVTPPERLAHGVGLSVRGVWDKYIDLRHLQEQNQHLAEENDRLRLEQASLAEDARDGQRLREMLDFRGQYIDKTVPAQVIGTSGTDTAHVIYIDKGYKDGLRSQMPVITPDGIVGKVKNVFPGTAQVLLISDQTSGAGVMLQTTRIRGVMKGDAAGQPQMINISPDDRIQAGEAVLTSGGDQVYPRGLPVGVVERVVSDPDSSYVNVLIKPNANLSKLEEVLVITEIAGKMPFTQEKDLLQSEVDALAEKQRAADILSEKLPSLTPEDFKKTNTDGDEEATAGGGDPARPMRPPAALHPDRYTPGAAPAAEALTPGEAPALAHRVTAPSEAGAAPASPNRQSTVASGLSGQAAPVSRFPAKADGVSARPVPAHDISAELAAGSKPATASGTKNLSSTPAGSRVAASTGSTGGEPTRRPASSLLAEQPADSGSTRRVATPTDTAGASGPVRLPRPAGAPFASGSASVPVGNLAAKPSSAGPPTARTASGTAPSGSVAPPSRAPLAGTAATNRAARGMGAVANQGGTAVPAPGSPSVPRTAATNNASPVPASGSTPTRIAPAGGTTPVVPGVNGAARSTAPVASPSLPATRGASASQRRIVIPGETAGGILTPAGMGSIGATPRPRTLSPPAEGATGTTGRAPSAADRPQGAKPAAAKNPPNSPTTPQNSKPRGTTVRPLSTPPPGGV